MNADLTIILSFCLGWAMVGIVIGGFLLMARNGKNGKK